MEEEDAQKGCAEFRPTMQGKEEDTESNETITDRWDVVDDRFVVSEVLCIVAHRTCSAATTGDKIKC